MSTINIATLMVLLKLNSQQYEEGTDKAKKKTADLTNLVGGALVGALTAATKAAIDFGKESVAEFQTFEKGIKEVYTLLPGASDEALGQMRDDIIDFSKEVGRTTDETVPALYQAISAGVPPENVFDFMEVASDAALGGVTDLETAVDGISSAVNAYGAEALSASSASDIMFTAVKLGKTDFEQLSNSLFNVVPTAASLGIKFEDVAASLAALTAQGTPTSVATTQLRQAFVEASKAGTGLDLAIKDLTGKSFAELIADGKTSTEIFSDLRNSMPEQEFRDLFGSVEAANAVLGVTSDTGLGIIDTFGGIEGTFDATAAAAETMAGSMEHLEARVEAAGEAFKIQAGESLSPLKRSYLETKLAMFEFAEANHALNAALADGTITSSELNAIQTKMAFTSYDAADAMADLEAAQNAANRSTEMSAKATAEATAETRDADAAMLQYTQSMVAAREAEQARIEHLRNFTQGAGDASGAQAMLNDETEAASVPAATYAEHLEAVAEAERQAAEATRQLAEESGGLFMSLSEAEGPLGVYYQSLTDVANGATDLTVNQDSLNNAMITAAANAGASASQLALLKVATGELTGAQAEAVIKQVALEQTLTRLGEQYANGTMSLGDYMSAAQQAVRDISNMAVEFDTTTGAVNTSNEAIGVLIGTMGQIPAEISTHISITSDPIPNMPGGGGGAGSGTGGGTPQAFALGGFTGGAENEIAGLVHGQEFVFSAPAVRSIGLPMLEMLHNQGLVAGGNSGVSVGDVYVTPGSAASPVEYGRATRTSLLKTARGMGLRI
ncbi:MAG: phage tail tape measure protein [Candidatus Competibacteraceae bacterium]|nr:phage tail tape measure protein [Anaerolineales bacterium]MCB1713605.1 phage tail tape measure protein [Candidatus Competibacteraceae bacterium]